MESMDITDLLTDGDNFVIVKVDNKRKAENVPTQIFDWWNYGGITRDVLLIDVAPVYIENYKLCLDKSAPDQISFNVNLNEKVAGRQITLSIPELKITKKLVTDDNGTAQVQFKAKKLQLWSPDNPKLYDVEITLADETLKDRIGFRTIETKGKQLLLNGKPIFLSMGNSITLTLRVSSGLNCISYP